MKSDLDFIVKKLTNMFGYADQKLVRVLDWQQNSDRVARMKKTAEIFTPAPLVCDMIDMIPGATTVCDGTYLDPACGNGQFLVWVYLYKLKAKINPMEALGDLYGVDIMQDNVEETRKRLVGIYNWAAHFDPKRPEKKIVNKNIVCADGLKYNYQFD